MIGLNKNGCRGIRGAKAIVGRTIPSEILAKTMKILQQYGQLTIEQFAVAFVYTYGYNLDATSIGFDNGMYGYFQQISDIVNLKLLDDGDVICSLKKNDSSPTKLCNGSITNGHIDANNNNMDQESIDVSQQKPYAQIVRSIDIHSRIDGIFHPNNSILWKHPYLKELLDNGVEDLVIPLSPYEMACQRNQNLVCSTAENFRNGIRKYPNGVPLSNICNIVYIDKRLFNAPSIADIVEENPEIFYSCKPDINSEDEPLIFDGRSSCYEDFPDRNHYCTRRSPSYIAFTSVVSGIYQKTVLLTKRAGPDGLKLSVWYQALVSNFQMDEDRYSDELLQMSPLTIFLALKNAGFIVLGSHKYCKNDLRLYLPPLDINFVELFMEIATKLKQERDAKKMLRQKIDVSKE